MLLLGNVTGRHVVNTASLTLVKLWYFEFAEVGSWCQFAVFEMFKTRIYFC